MDYDAKLSQLKKQLENAKTERTRAETKLESLNKQRDDLLNEFKELGINPENAENEIEKLKEDIDKLIGEAEELLPPNINE